MSRRRYRRLDVATTIAAAVVLGTFGTAGADEHHAEIAAAVDCRGVVSFRLTSWQGRADDPATSEDDRAASRRNDRVDLHVSTDGGRTFRPLGGAAAVALDASNGFSFDGAFRLSAPLPASVMVSAREGPWGDGARGGSRSTPVLRVPPCRQGDVSAAGNGRSEPSSSTSARPGSTGAGPPSTGDGRPASSGPPEVSAPPQATDPGAPAVASAASGTTAPSPPEHRTQLGEGGSEAVATGARARDGDPTGGALVPALAGGAGLSALLAAGLWARRRLLTEERSDRRGALPAGRLRR